MPFRARIHPASIARRAAAGRSHLRNRLDAAPSSTPLHRASTAAASTLVQQPSLIFLRHASTSSSSRPFRPAADAPPSTLESISNFFSISKKRRSRVTIHNARDEFLRTARKGDVEKMKMSYDVVLHAIAQNAQAGSSLSTRYLGKDDLVHGMNALAESEYPLQSLPVLLSMYDDLGRVFGFEPEFGHRWAVVVGLCRAGRIKQALPRLDKLDPALVDWTEMLRLATAYGPTLVPVVLSRLRAARTANGEDYLVLLESLRERLEGLEAKERRDEDELRILLRHMGEDGVEQGRDIEAEIARIHILLGNLDMAEEIVQRWQGDRSESSWNALVELALAKGDGAKAVELCLAMRDQGHTVPSQAVAELARRDMDRGASPEEAVDQAERRTLTQLDSAGWATIIRACCPGPGTKSTDLGLQAYRAARGRGTEVDARLVQWLIPRLCAAAKLDVVHLDQALELYDDLLRYDVDLYSLESYRVFQQILPELILACSLHAAGGSRSAATIRLLQDAGEYGVDVADILEPLHALVQACPDHHTAYEMYRHWAAVHELSEDEYNTLLTAFLLVRPADEKSVLPPADLFLEIVRSMHQRGITPGPHVITSLISRYGYLIKQLKRKLSPEDWKDNRPRYYTAIHDLHTRIKLDASVKMNIPLLNAFMDAYSSLGATTAALMIWDDLVDRRARTPVRPAREMYPYSVAIALDICGWSNLPRRADRIWAWGRRHGFADGIRQWNNWVETLLRLGRYDEATEIVLNTLRNPPRAEGVPPANAETVRIFLKFTWRINNLAVRNQLVDRTRATYPEFWDQAKGRISRPADKPADE